MYVHCVPWVGFFLLYLPVFKEIQPSASTLPPMSRDAMVKMGQDLQKALQELYPTMSPADDPILKTNPSPAVTTSTPIPESSFMLPNITIPLILVPTTPVPMPTPAPTTKAPEVTTIREQVHIVADSSGHLVVILGSSMASAILVLAFVILALYWFEKVRS